MLLYMQETLYQVVCSGFSLVVKSSNAHITPPNKNLQYVTGKRFVQGRLDSIVHFDNLISSIISQSYALYIIYLK